MRRLGLLLGRFDQTIRRTTRVGTVSFTETYFVDRAGVTWRPISRTELRVEPKP